MFGLEWKKNLEWSRPGREPGGVGGGAALPYKRLMGMCRWMGSHFHNWIDYNGVAHFLILGVRQFFIFTVGEK